MIYNVRCCCQPKRILGWIDLQGQGSYHFVHQMVLFEASLYDPGAKPEKIVEPHAHAVQIRTYMHNDGSSERAVYSDDRPIEWWRQVRGFHENFGGPT